MAFNIRVYGVLVNDNKQVLVSDERILNNDEVTKFPGGGLELGEGPVDCLVRECREEMNAEVKVTGHLYTTDFFQQSAFNEQHQLISIYYLLAPVTPLMYPVSNGAPVFPDHVSENFRFIDWDYFSPGTMTLPVDKIAAQVLKEKYG
ncbi:NUDIX domain-containing protein [Niabella ginsenosidivorans]|nr:NUDIX domain-containing protein [Niabella ginsenosidivorans]